MFLLLIFLGATILVVSLILINQRLLRQAGAGGEFLMYWTGTRDFIFEHIDPYSYSVPRKVQEMVYGRTGLPYEKPYILDIPFFLLILFIPFSLVRDPQLALAIFSLFLELCILTFSIAIIRLAGFSGKFKDTTILYIFGFFHLFTILALLEGSFSIIYGLLLAWILIALEENRDELAGVIMVALLWKWEIGGAALLLICLRSIREHRWRMFAGFGMGWFVLLILSYFLYPNWLIPYWRAVINNLRIDYGYSTHTIIMRALPSVGPVVAWALIISLVIMLLMEWSKVREGTAQQHFWVLCLALAVTPLLGLKSELSNYSVLVMPTFLVLIAISQRWFGSKKMLYPLLIVFITLLPWLFNLQIITDIEKSNAELLFLIYPIIIIIGLYWIRWWSIRPPRTILDQLTQSST